MSIKDDVIEVSVRSKRQVIILTVYIYRPETLYITQNKHGMLFTGTRIHIIPNSAYLRRFGGDLWWFAYKASRRKSPKTPPKRRKCAGFGTVDIPVIRKSIVFHRQAKLLVFVPNFGGGLQWFGVVCGGLPAFHCFHHYLSSVSTSIVPNSGGDLWWFALIVGLQ